MKRLALVVAALPLAAAAHAHDFWIEPSTFHPARGETVSVGLRVGKDFVGDPVPRVTPMIDRFIVRQGRREEEIAGIDNTDPAGWFRADGRAPAIIAYASRGARIDMPADRFEEYLREQGLERIIAIRARRGEQTAGGREIFVRFAKTLLEGGPPSIAVTQPIGLRYEIVPDVDPVTGINPFHGRLLFQRTPATGALVLAVFHDDPSLKLTTRSDRDGKFAFVLPRPGVWLIKSVRMIDAPSGSGAEWQSLWASLTFDWRAPERHP